MKFFDWHLLTFSSSSSSSSSFSSSFSSSLSLSSSFLATTTYMHQVLPWEGEEKGKGSGLAMFSSSRMASIPSRVLSIIACYPSICVNTKTTQMISWDMAHVESTGVSNFDRYRRCSELHCGSTAWTIDRGVMHNDLFNSLWLKSCKHALEANTKETHVRNRDLRIDQLGHFKAF